MKRTLSIILIISILLLCLTGCSSKDNTEAVVNDDQNDVMPDDSIERTDFKIIGGDLKSWTSNSFAAYEINIFAYGSASFITYDYATKSITDVNTDILKGISLLGWVVPAATDNYLYIIRRGMLPSFGDEDAPALIIRTDTDGNDKTTISIDNEYAAFDAGMIASNGEDIYFILNIVDEYENITGHILCRTDFASGSIVELASINDYQYVSIRGAYKGGLLLTYSTDDAVYFAVYDESSGTVSNIDFSIKDLSISYTVLGGVLYMMHAEDGTISCYDLAGGNLTEIDVNLNPDSKNGKYYIYDSAADGIIQYSIVDSELDESYYYALNTEDLSVFEWLIHDDAIFAENENYYLICTGNHFTDSGGVRDYSLISKADYWNGIRNYIPFEDNTH